MKVAALVHHLPYLLSSPLWYVAEVWVWEEEVAYMVEMAELQKMAEVEGEVAVSVTENIILQLVE
jgi:hypothetical protein